MRRSSSVLVLVPVTLLCCLLWKPTAAASLERKRRRVGHLASHQRTIMQEEWGRRVKVLQHYDDDDDNKADDTLTWERLLEENGMSSLPLTTPAPSPGLPSRVPTDNPTRRPTNVVVVDDDGDDDMKKWKELGGRIRPLSNGGVGHDLAMSAAGDVLAVGVPDDAPGYVGVYKLSTDGTSWELVGSEIIDPDQDGGDRFASTVDLSSDGLTVASGSGYSDGLGTGEVLAGRARVFFYNATLDTWLPKGQGLAGRTPCRSLGWSTALAGVGQRWVVSSPDVSGSGDYRCDDMDWGDKRGIVQVFDFVGETWIQAGPNIVGKIPDSQLGVAVAISRNGKRVAALSPGLHRPSDPASASVYEQNSNGQWQQMGEDIAMEIVEFYTRGISLSADGSRLAVASKRFSDGTAFVKVLEWNNNAWEQVGDDIEDEDGCCFFYTFENSVTLSDDGSRLVFGNSGHEPPGTPNPGIFRGIVRVYDWKQESMSWRRVGQSIPGDTVTGELWFGYSTAISENGEKIAAGAPTGANNYVQAYELK